MKIFILANLETIYNSNYFKLYYKNYMLDVHIIINNIR